MDDERERNINFFHIVKMRGKSGRRKKRNINFLFLFFHKTVKMWEKQLND